MAHHLVQEPLSKRIIAAAITVHRELGPGLLEAAYEECLMYELASAGLHFEHQVVLPLVYNSIKLTTAFRIDLIVEGQIILELKAVDKITSLHVSQLLTYVKLSEVEVGLLFNFNSSVLKDGIRRVVHTRKSGSPRLRVFASPTTPSP